MKAIVNIFLKNGVLDPQGKATHHALDSMNFSTVEDVRIGKQVIIKLSNTDKEEAYKEVKNMCEELLSNTVIEDYTVEIV